MLTRCFASDSRLFPLRELSRFWGRSPSDEVDRVPDRTERRRVAEVELHDIVDGHARLDGGGEHVDALCRALQADDLRAQQAPAAPLGQRLERELAALG